MVFPFPYYFCVRNPLKLCYISVYRHENRSISDFRKIENPSQDKVILANLNSISISDKFSSHKEIISNNFDTLAIQETKIHDTFPKGSCDVPEYKRPYRKDRNIHGGGILVHVREDIPSNARESTDIDIE